MTKLIEFETDRLYLRQWIEADREPFARLNADSRVMEFLPSLLDRAASDAMFDRLQAGIFDRGWGLWAVELKQDRQFIGFVGLHIPKADLPFHKFTLLVPKSVTFQTGLCILLLRYRAGTRPRPYRLIT
jgi:RimJ/RimL family protein N-acetyltransferase